jgi:hypothetical protein
MVFNLQMAEIDKARNVAQQALKQILYKEDADRLNVWVALLNLENMYGTQATIDDVFNKANQNCDSLKIHFHMAEIYARSSKLQVIKLRSINLNLNLKNHITLFNESYKPHILWGRFSNVTLNFFLKSIGS